MEHFWTWMRNGTPVVTTPDGVDVSNEDELAERLRDAAAQNPVVVVDATYGTFFGVGAMRALDRAARTMIAAGGELRIVITNPKTREFLGIVGFDANLRIFDDLDEALAASQLKWKPQLQHLAA